jgi:hypothetical protein
MCKHFWEGILLHPWVHSSIWHDFGHLFPDWNLERQSTCMVHFLNLHDCRPVLHLLRTFAEIPKAIHDSSSHLDIETYSIPRLYTPCAHLSLHVGSPILAERSHTLSDYLSLQHLNLLPVLKVWHRRKSWSTIGLYFQFGASRYSWLQKIENHDTVHVWESTVGGLANLDHVSDGQYR